eukprot:11213770-Lingulodinium_polyedra.AAC.1
MFTVIVMGDYISLDKSQGYSCGGGLDKEYMALAKELSFVKNVVYALPTDAPRFEMPQSSMVAASEKVRTILAASIEAM